MSMQLRERARGPAVLFCLAVGGMLAPSACAERSEASLGFQEPGPPVTPGPFVTPDASLDPEAGGLTRYCPSDQCPSGHMTCPLSNFRCDVNLLTDRNNCGACGVKCPATKNNAMFECVDGTCVMTCMADSFHDDCDGIIDNGCETSLADASNCKKCGNQCDPGVPCVERSLLNYGCGCDPGEIHCVDKYPACLNPNTDDNNCGACDVACDPAEGGAPPPYANTYYGCAKAKCGAVKCLPYWGDCDGDPQNGCETALTTNDDCAACGASCAPDEACRYSVPLLGPPILSCMCPGGQTFCPAGFEIDGISAGKCHDLTSDPLSCGACGNVCSWNGTVGCVYGVCKLHCFEGSADCNGSEEDACEVNTSSDPSNCGGCGNACDAVAGQACVGGRCVVKPCNETDADAGGPTR